MLISTAAVAVAVAVAADVVVVFSVVVSVSVADIVVVVLGVFKSRPMPHSYIKKNCITLFSNRQFYTLY